MKTKWLAFVHPADHEVEAAENLAGRVAPWKVREGLLPRHDYLLADEANAVAFEAEARRHGLDYTNGRVRFGYLVSVSYKPDQKTSVDALARWVEPIFVSDGVTPSYEYVLWDEASFVAFKAEAAALGFPDPWIRKERVYTRAEIVNASLLDLHLRTAERGDSRPCGGTKYDFSQACPGCGTGAVQVSPAMLRRPDLRYDRKSEIFQTFTHFFVSPLLAEGLSQAEVSGLELRQAVNIADGSPLPWYQMIASTTLPPLSDLTMGTDRENPCQLCGMNGYYETPSEPLVLTYDGKTLDPDDLPDVVGTYEWFGFWKVKDSLDTSVLGSPRLLVKPKVFSVFEEFKVRRVEWSPVRFI